jgi:phosphatidate phosphatase APP1
MLKEQHPRQGETQKPVAHRMRERKSLLTRIFEEAEAALDWSRHRIRRRRGQGEYYIQPYRGHGTPARLYVSGRVFQGEPLPSANQDDAVVRNLWHTVRRLGSDEVPAARVRASLDGVVREILADDSGFFEIELPVETSPGAGEVWRAVQLELVDPVPSAGTVSTHALAIVPPAQARFGIISDIDDTVVETDVANLFRMLRLVLLTNAHTRLPFAGIAAFYRALHEGAAGTFTNPIFYVSSGPWNFYDLLTEVFEVHDIPVGPILLKDYGLARDLLLSRGHVDHKIAAIERIFDTHPDLRFILIGDSGQKDPEVYLEAVRRHPERVLAIYIRDVTTTERDREVHGIAQETRRLGVEMLLVPDTLTAAVHAAEAGFIDPAGIPEIRGERAEDLAAPGPFESVIRRA